jgi:hypothetical protein
MGGAPQGAMRVASQIWQVVFASQTLQVFCLAFRKKAQYVVVNDLLGLCVCCFVIIGFKGANKLYAGLVDVGIFELLIEIS